MHSYAVVWDETGEGETWMVCDTDEEREHVLNWMWRMGQSEAPVFFDGERVDTVFIEETSYTW